MKIIAEELVKIARLLVADDDDKAYTINFFMPYKNSGAYKDARKEAEKAMGKLQGLVNSIAGEYDPQIYMGQMNHGEISLPVEFESKSNAQNAMREFKASPEVKKLGITVKWEKDW